VCVCRDNVCGAARIPVLTDAICACVLGGGVGEGGGGGRAGVGFVGIYFSKRVFLFKDVP